jgi:crossover junction endodeoxyribonuclease RusA
VILELPWPPPVLLPNQAKRAGNYHKARKAAAVYRRYCWALALERKAKGRILMVEFYPPDRRGRDDDGMIAAFKSGRDGIADATGIDDKHYRPTYEIREPVAGGKIIVTLGE